MRFELPLPPYVQVTPDMGEKLRPYFAIGLYLSQTLSLRAAARVAGMDYGDFLDFLAEFEIPSSLMTYEDVMADVAKMRDLPVPRKATAAS